MPIYQAFNKKTKAWVKYKFTKGGVKILNVKEKMPKVKFKGVPVKGQRRR